MSGLLRQPSDEPVAVRLLAFAAALLPVIAASGLAYKYTSGSALAKSLYKVCVCLTKPLVKYNSVSSSNHLDCLSWCLPPVCVLLMCVLPMCTQMYCLLIRVEAGPEPNLLSYLVTNLVFLIGFFTLAVLLGVVNDEVQKRADDQRHGRNPVKAKDHVLILNWWVVLSCVVLCCVVLYWVGLVGLGCVHVPVHDVQQAAPFQRCPNPNAVVAPTCPLFVAVIAQQE